MLHMQRASLGLASTSLCQDLHHGQQYPCAMPADNCAACASAAVKHVPLLVLVYNVVVCK